jgi:bacterioferritin-associated ferredoxin
MIICSCNVFSESDVRRSVANAQNPPKDARGVYPLLGCAPQCGKCAPTIERILGEIFEKEDRRDSATSDPPRSRSLLEEEQAV